MTVTPGWAGPTGMASATVLRFSRTERVFHWIHAAAFFAMLTSGLALYLPSLATTFGSRASVKTFHLFVAGGWICALLLTTALGSRRALRSTRRDLEEFTRADVDWLRRAGGRPGRFNAGQKAHAIVQAAFAVLFVLSGMLLWLGERDTRFRLDGTILLHDGATLFASLFVIGHLYLAVVHPSTRPALGGMFGGAVPARWAAQHHPRWTIEPPPPRPVAEPERSSVATWALAGLAVATGVATVLLFG